MSLKKIPSELQGRLSYHLSYGFGGRFTAPTARGSLLPWTIAGITGLLLGISLLGASALPQRWVPLAILVILAPFAVMIAGNVEKFLLAAIILEIPLGVDIHLGYQEAAAALGAVGGLNLSLTTLCLALLYALWLARLLAKRATPPPHLLRSVLPLTAYLAVAALSLLVARDVALTSFYIFMLMQAFLLYLYVLNAVRTRKDVLFVVAMLFISLALQGLIMIGVRFASFDFNVASVSTYVHGDFGLRGGGTLGSPNGAAGYLTLLLAPALSVLIVQFQGRQWLKWLAVFAFGLGGAALLITQSRGGWAAFAVSVALLYVLAWHRGWLSTRVHLAALAVVLMFATVSQGEVIDRLSGNDGGAAFSRVPLMQLALQIVRDNPFLGVGANNFAVVLQQYVTPEFGREWIYTVHNKYLLIWAETGIVALIAFLWFLTVVLRRGWQVWRSNDRLLSPLILGFAVAIVGHMLHMTVDIFNDRPHVQTLWLIAGLITATSHIKRLEAEAASSVAVAVRPEGVSRGIV